MTRDIGALIDIIRGCLIVAAFFSTVFPVLYYFSYWRETRLGQLLMLQAVALALLLDTTVIFQWWRPSDIIVMFWIEAILFALIAIANASLTFMLWRLNHPRRKK